MDKKFLAEHYREFCFTNEEMLGGDIRGIILYFNGLGHVINGSEDMIDAPHAAEHHILYITPNYNPWSWMNAKTVAYVDAIVEVFIDKYGLPADIPVGLYGGSMGGYSCFHYAMKTKYNVVAADLNCPCCNMEYEVYCNHCSVLRTYFESSMTDTEDFAAYVRENSPINMIGRLKKIPYRFAVGLKDMSLIPSQHAFRMIPMLRDAGFEVDLCEYPGAGHCNIGAEARYAEHTWLIAKMEEALSHSA